MLDGALTRVVGGLAAAMLGGRTSCAMLDGALTRVVGGLAAAEAGKGALCARCWGGR